MVSFCGVDPGFSGALSIISDENVLIFPMPITKEVKKVKGKNKIKKSYNLLEIRKILVENLDKNDVIIVEKAYPRPNEGSISSFSSGKGFGQLEGLIIGLFDKYPIEISPQSWKKHFPELNNSFILEKKEEIKKIKENNKIIKDKEQKNQNNKEIEKINSLIKKEAKKLARELVSKKHSDKAHLFKKVNSDGMAESLLMAIYGKEKLINELV